MPDLDQAGDLELGSAVVRPGDMQGPRIRAGYKLVFVHQGSAVVEHDHQERELPAGRVALLLPGHHEVIRFSPERESRWSWLVLQSVPLPSLYLAALDVAPFSLPISAQMAALLAACLDLRRRRAAPRASVVVTAALALYCEEAQQQGLVEIAPRRHPAVAEALAFIRHRLRTHITLRDIAAAVGITPEYLVRLFHKEVGTTPHRYLQQARVRLGIHMLENTPTPVGDIARLVGFKNVYHFSHVVRATTGLPPTQVRTRSGNMRPRAPSADAGLPGEDVEQ